MRCYLGNDANGARTRRPTLLRSYFTLIVASLLQFTSPSDASTLTVSTEAFGNNTASRTIAGTLDDSWAAGFPTGSHRPDLFSGGSGYTGSKVFTDPSGASYQVDWQLGHINAVGPGLPTSTSFVAATSGTATYGTSNTIQSGAPNPYSGDTRLSTGFSGAGLNGIQFDFANGATDLYEFGIFIGDLESRANNGTEGRVILFDSAGGLIGDHPIRYTGSVDGSAGPSSYTSVEPLGSPSGAANNGNGDWGNATTAFLSIRSYTAIGSAIIHVGDDDHTTNNTGTQEQLGVTGFQVPAAPTGIAQLTASKTVEIYDPGGYAIPGRDVIYHITVVNEGLGAADTDSILLIDDLPPETTFYNGDIDDGGPETGPIQFAQSGAALSFDDAFDLKFSDGATPPADFAACAYSPAPAYDANITYVCLNPKGSMASDPSNTEFTISFRAKIR